MKVILDVNLKIGTGRIIPMGTVFSDEGGTPIPEFILRRIRRRQAHEVPDGKSVVVNKEEKPKVVKIKELSVKVPKKELPEALSPSKKKTLIAKAKSKE
jgi:hypothetical protein